MTAESDVETAVDRPVGGRWWYWIAAVPVLWVLGLLAGVVLVPLFLLGVLGGAESAVGATVVVFAVVLPLALAGVLVSIMCAVALYVDSQAIAESDLEWEPDPVLWGVLGVAGIFVGLLQLGAAAYYLYQRHERVGRP